MKINFVYNISDFNNLIDENSLDLVCFISDKYDIEKEYIPKIIEIFDIFKEVSGVYTDIKDNIISFVPFAPNRFLANIYMISPIIVRCNIMEKMVTDSYNDYFEKTKYKKMYYHLAKPVFKKI